MAHLEEKGPLNDQNRHNSLPRISIVLQEDALVLFARVLSFLGSLFIERPFLLSSEIVSS